MGFWIGRVFSPLSLSLFLILFFLLDTPDINVLDMYNRIDQIIILTALCTFQTNPY